MDALCASEFCHAVSRPDTGLSWALFVQIQPQWEPLVSRAKSGMLSALHKSGVAECDVLGVYLRGSVPQGAAVEYISDLDLSAYILISADRREGLERDFTLIKAATGIPTDYNNPGNVINTFSTTASQATAADTSGNTDTHKQRGSESAAVDLRNVLEHVAGTRAAVEAQFPFCSKVGALNLCCTTMLASHIHTLQGVA